VSEPHEYDGIKLWWGVPPESLGDWTFMAIVRSGFGYPSTPTDGEVILGLDGYRENGEVPGAFVDEGLPAGQWFYYTLMFRVGTRWYPVNYTSEVIPVDYAHRTPLYDGVPPFYQETDAEQYGGTRFSMLERWFSTIGYDLDLTRTLAEGLDVAFDPDRSPQPILNALGVQNLGFGTNNAMGDIRYRGVIARSREIQGERGTYGGLEAYLAAATQYEVHVSPGLNLMLLGDDARPGIGHGNWSPTHFGLNRSLTGSGELDYIIEQDHSLPVLWNQRSALYGNPPYSNPDPQPFPYVGAGVVLATETGAHPDYVRAAGAQSGSGGSTVAVTSGTEGYRQVLYYMNGVINDSGGETVYDALAGWEFVGSGYYAGHGTYAASVGVWTRVVPAGGGAGSFEVTWSGSGGSFKQGWVHEFLPSEVSDFFTVSGDRPAPTEKGLAPAAHGVVFGAVMPYDVSVSAVPGWLVQLPNGYETLTNSGTTSQHSIVLYKGDGVIAPVTQDRWISDDDDDDASCYADGTTFSTTPFIIADANPDECTRAVFRFANQGRFDFLRDPNITITGVRLRIDTAPSQNDINARLSFEAAPGGLGFGTGERNNAAALMAITTTTAGVVWEEESLVTGGDESPDLTVPFMEMLANGWEDGEAIVLVADGLSTAPDHRATVIGGHYATAGSAQSPHLIVEFTYTLAEGFSTRQLTFSEGPSGVFPDGIQPFPEELTTIKYPISTCTKVLAGSDPEEHLAICCGAGQQLTVSASTTFPRTKITQLSHLNPFYRGVPVDEGETYYFSFWMCAPEGSTETYRVNYGMAYYPRDLPLVGFSDAFFAGGIESWAGIEPAAIDMVKAAVVDDDSWQRYVMSSVVPEDSRFLVPVIWVTGETGQKVETPRFLTAAMVNKTQSVEVGGVFRPDYYLKVGENPAHLIGTTSEKVLGEP
jgi:hypothetical protein